MINGLSSESALQFTNVVNSLRTNTGVSNKKERTEQGNVVLFFRGSSFSEYTFSLSTAGHHWILPACTLKSNANVERSIAITIDIDYDLSQGCRWLKKTFQTDAATRMA